MPYDRSFRCQYFIIAVVIHNGVFVAIETVLIVWHFFSQSYVSIAFGLLSLFYCRLTLAIAEDALFAMQKGNIQIRLLLDTLYYILCISLLNGEFSARNNYTVGRNAESRRDLLTQPQIIRKLISNSETVFVALNMVGLFSV